MRNPKHASARSAIPLILYALVVALYCCWVLSMPVFPSQDGPLHLYYVNIFRQLLSHREGVYSQTFYVAHILPPYSLYYYGLIAIGTLTSLETADKLLVCLCFIILAVGLRTLVRTVSGRSEWVPFLILPILINWPLMMGFVNYSLATGMACFALAIWCGAWKLSGAWRRVCFLVMLAAIVLTHPVPWMFVLAFTGFDLACRLLALWPRQTGWKHAPETTSFLADLLTVLVASSAVLYLRLFSPQIRSADTAPAGLFLREAPLRATRYLSGRGLAVFSGNNPAAWIHRGVLGIILVSALVFTLSGLLRPVQDDNARRGRVWGWFAIAFVIALPLIPPNLNGSWFFAARLLSLVYIALVVACSPRLGRSRMAIPLASLCAILSLFNLAVSVKRLSPIAREIATLRDAPVVHTARPGLLMRFPSYDYPAGLGYEPFYWAGAAYFRRNNLLLYDTAWLELPIIPIKPRPQQLAALDSAFLVRTPVNGAAEFSTTQSRAATLSRVGFVLGMRNPAPAHENVLASAPGGQVPGPDAQAWHCLNRPAYELCTSPEAVGSTLGSAP
jgi:hypothetical protein